MGKLISMLNLFSLQEEASGETHPNSP